MSRIAKKPIIIPNGVSLDLHNSKLTVTGSKGSIDIILHNTVQILQEQNTITISLKKMAYSKFENAISGTTRALINNMVVGVSKGFEKKLVLVGVGFRAQLQDNKLLLSLGFSHPVIFEVPIGITITLPTATEIIIAGTDKQIVGQVAADIRRKRPPEPYKGKGIRYALEQIILKQGKKK